MSYYVAAYDIAHGRRRRHVARILSSYGRRLQRSVFEIDLEPEDLPDLRRRIGALLDPADEFDLIPIDRRQPERRLRWQRPPYPDPVVVFSELP